MQGKIRKNHIELRLQNDFKNKPFYIFTDPLRLRQVLNNLLSNALKFTNSGYIELGYLNFGTTIQFYVKDTGIGIPDKMQPFIFDRFRSTEKPERKEYGCKGLGLSISRSLVKLLGGSIWLNSAVGVGTNFYFTIKTEQSKHNEYNLIKASNIKVPAY